MSADGLESWVAHSAAQYAEIQRLEALVINRTEERDEWRARTNQMSELRAEAIDAVRRVARARDLVQAELTRVDEAAGRDIAKPEEPLVERVADLLLGRTEATQRALELAAEVAQLRRELAWQTGATQDTPRTPAPGHNEGAPTE